jgi:YfiH family protein
MKNLPLKSWDFDHLSFEVYLERPNFLVKDCHQVHGTEVLEASLSQSTDQADGLISVQSDLKNFSLAIKTADCLPVLLMNETHVALVHLGWRGLNLKLLKHDLLEQKWSTAFIGPGIAACCFEVTPDFKDNFPGSEKFFISRDEKLYFDLKLECTHQLRSLFSSIVVKDAHICTCCDHRFWSYRRDKTKNRIWNIVKTKENYGNR